MAVMKNCNASIIGEDENDILHCLFSSRLINCIEIVFGQCNAIATLLARIQKKTEVLVFVFI